MSDIEVTLWWRRLALVSLILLSVDAGWMAHAVYTEHKTFKPHMDNVVKMDKPTVLCDCVMEDGGVCIIDQNDDIATAFNMIRPRGGSMTCRNVETIK